MAASRKRTAGELPRPLLAIGVPCAGVLLVVFFLIRGFPYDQLGAQIVRRVEQSQGARVVIGDLAPVMQLAGPALQANGVRATLAGGDVLQIDRALVRAAWSTSWLTGDPALHVELDGPAGGANGTLQWNGATAWNGTIWGVPTAQPPLSDFVRIFRLDGSLDAMIDIRIGDQERDGEIYFEVRDGSFWLPDNPVALPFDLLSAELNFGGDAYLTVDSINIEGDSVSGSGSGEIAHAPDFEQAPVSFELELNLDAKTLSKLRGSGLRAHRSRPTKIRISGTVAEPTRQ